MKFFLPSWNGDFRIEGDPKNDEQSVLIVQKATPAERRFLSKFMELSVKKGWTTKEPHTDFTKPENANVQVTIGAHINTTSKALIKLARPSKQTLTAVRFKDGKLEVAEGSASQALDQLLKEPQKDTHSAAEAEVEKEPKSGVSVARPTPCCPQCVPGSVELASEVLLAFLTDEEHEQWAKHRAIIIKGGLSGHRYRLAHRNSKLGVAQTKICYDLETKEILHFHDWAVPPEEEVLAAKLILEHREPWLRNEATNLSRRGPTYKNPFGNGLDGTDSTRFTTELGGLLSAFA